MEPGGQGADVLRNRGEVEPVKVDQLQHRAASKVGEGVQVPARAAQHLQLVQGGQVDEGVRMVKVDRVTPQLHLLQVLQMGEHTAGYGGNSVACKCAENINLEKKERF